MADVHCGRRTVGPGLAFLRAFCVQEIVGFVEADAGAAPWDLIGRLVVDGKETVFFGDFEELDPQEGGLRCRDGLLTKFTLIGGEVLSKSTLQRARELSQVVT